MRFSLVTLLLIAAFTGAATAQVTSLYETFNTSCPAGNHGPADWMVYSTTISITGEDQWTCGHTYGRSGTPGISCSGYYGTPPINHVDTSFLISPELDLSGYPGNIYLNYDTKTTRLHLAARLDIVATNNLQMVDTPGGPGVTDYLASTPVIGMPDSTDWVTHQADLTSYKGTAHLYVGFRYACTTVPPVATRWFLDNIRTTTSPLAVGALTNTIITFGVAGIPRTDEVALYINTRTATVYTIAIYDMVGHKVHEETAPMAAGKNTHVLHPSALTEGLYVLKLSTDDGYTVTRTYIR